MKTKTHQELSQYISKIDPIKYAKTRNYINGSVTMLSPYITHGVLTIYEIVNIILSKYTVEQSESLLKELLWREYFVQVHYRKWDDIFVDMEESKTNISKQDILSQKIITWNTDSIWVNETVSQLIETWYLHNHQRMRFASYCTHYAKLYWKSFADRTYYHFLDWELWSNHLSRQRVESTFSHKPYFMNEDNITRYRPNHKDKIYSHDYETLHDILFDPKRISVYQNDIDLKNTFSTDLSWFDYFDDKLVVEDNITIINPWDFHPQKINKNEFTVCILDEEFFAKHPRSPNRINFIKSYADIYGINIYIWNIDKIISWLISQNKKITIYETHNPYYRQANEKHTKHINLIPAKRCSPIAKVSYNKKFFWFWEKSVKYLYNIQKTHSLL